MTTDKKLPKAQPYSIPKIMRMREIILSEVLHPYYGLLMAGDLFLQMVTDLHRAVVLAAPLDIVFNSCRNLAGRELTKPLAEDLAWRIAGNWHRLRKGIPALPWPGQVEREWVPIQVVDLRRRVLIYNAKKEIDKARANSRGLVHRRGVQVRLRVLAGLPAGRETEQFWGEDYCERLKEAFGFDRWNRERYSRVVSRRESFPFLDMREFYRMRMIVLVEPTKCRTAEEVGFEKFRSTTSTLHWCRELIRKRLRDGFPCPLNYTNDQMDCFRCHAGLDQCRAACHKITFSQGFCPRCGKQRWFDPANDAPNCVDCSAVTE